MNHDADHPRHASSPSEPRTAAPEATPATGTGSVGDAAHPASRSSSLRSGVEWVLLIAVAVAVALFVRAFLLQVFYIPSESMVPTLVTDDRVLVNKISYELHDVNRGDVIVFERSPDQVAVGIQDLIKRVVGLPGETLEARGGTVYVDGRPLPEPYLPPGVETADFGPVTVEAGLVFVMGDNRDDSQDSRVFGAIDQDLIKGRAFALIWPPSRLDGL